ncbi:lysophosphatidic acid receptor 6-like [Haliotis asinina]|uniref:lysophosphatidic acid receptor 6-like n=1 Tax=Haliotis asinina TaxID=109174 RepID=UPI00353197D8
MALHTFHICCLSVLLGAVVGRAEQFLTTTDYGNQGGVDISSPDTKSVSGSRNCTVDPDLLSDDTDGVMYDTSDVHPNFNDTDGETKTKSCKENGELPNQPRISITSQGKLSKEQYEVGAKVCLYLFYPLFISAVLLNTFNLLVYTDPAMRSPTSTYLIAIAAKELLFALFNSVRHILRQVHGTEALKRQDYLYFAMYGSNLFSATLRVLMYCLSVLVSTERFLAVAFPLKSRNFRLIKSPIIFITSVTIICFSCHLPGSLKFDIVLKPNSTDYTLALSAIYINNKDFIDGLSIANSVLFTYIVLVCGLIMNLCVLLALRKHSKNRAKMNTTVDAEKTAKRERQTTITILTSTFLFTVLAIPLTTDALVQRFVPEYTLYRKEHYVNMLMKDVNGLLIMFSLSTDFVFYITLSKAYRRTFFRRLPFMATMCRQQKYKRESSLSEPQTKMSTISEDVRNYA